MVLGGCFGLHGQPGTPDGEQAEPGRIPRQVEELAGSWEYMDSNGTFPITLDKEGNGAYDWKGGAIETVELTRGVWKGKWYQKENDREGEFLIKFSSEPLLADGQWWYTRIGSDVQPLDPGGRFTMRYLSGNLKNENNEFTLQTGTLH